MLNKVRSGKTLELTAPYAVNGGDFFLVGALGGVAVASIANGASGEVETSGGVFELPKATGAAWAVGDVLYWDATNKVFTKTSSGNTKAGVAYAAAISGDTTGLVKLFHTFG